MQVKLFFFILTLDKDLTFNCAFPKMIMKTLAKAQKIRFCTLADTQVFFFFFLPEHIFQKKYHKS